MTKTTRAAGSWSAPTPRVASSEIITLIDDDGRELIIHAMKARNQYLNDL